MQLKIGIVILLFLPTIIFSQTITGTLENNLGQKIMAANLLVKDSANAAQIKEFSIVQNGQYSITLKKSYTHLVLVVTALNHNNQVFEITNFNPQKNYTHNFILIPKTAIELAEVTVTAKEKPFVLKDDTVRYNVEAYKDGTERKIEDVIKKLPGIEVNEKTGEIKYKGKSIETVMLDGDDLFSSNYKIGTKNINVDMVQQVQAIENYSNNPLLKGIESNEKVALNLKLKKNKVNITGNASIGTGFSSGNNLVHNTDATILGVSKFYKSFGILSYNNVGVNNTPFDYFNYSPTTEQIKEGNINAKKIIPETFFASELDDKRANRNNDWFANYNQILKISPKLSFKNNFYWLQNNINSSQLFKNENIIDNQKFTTTDDLGIVKNAKQYRADIELKYNTSLKSSIVYNSRISIEKIENLIDVLQNKTDKYSTKLASKDNFIKQTVLYTQKLSDTKALQTSINYSSSNLPQSYILNPSVYNPNLYSSDEQHSNFKKQDFNTQLLFLASWKKAYLTASIGYSKENNPFFTSLTSVDSAKKNVDTITSFLNNATYKFNEAYNQVSLKFLLGKWRITTTYKFSFLKQNIINNQQKTQYQTQNFIIEPTINIKRKVTDISSISAAFTLTNKPFSENYLFQNPVFISNRISLQNEVGLHFQKNYGGSLFYIINDLYRQYQILIGADYVVSKGNFFAKNDIQLSNTGIINFYLPAATKRLNINFSIEKFINLIETNVRLKSNYAVSSYQNILNGSNLRNNKNKILFVELFCKTAFDKKLNFENIAIFNKQTSISDGFNPFTNNAVVNTFKIIYAPSKYFNLLFCNDFYVPNTNQQQQYSFYDLSVRYTPKHKKYMASFWAKNLGNVKYFTQTNTSDFATTASQNNLIERYIMLNMSFNF